MARLATNGLVSVIVFASCASIHALLEFNTAIRARGIISVSYRSTGPMACSPRSNSSRNSDATSAMPWFAASPLTSGLVSWVFSRWGKTDGDDGDGVTAQGRQGVRKPTHGHGMRCVPDQRYSPTSVIPQPLSRHPILKINSLCLCPLRYILHNATKRFCPAARQFLHPGHSLLILLRDIKWHFSSAKPRAVGPAYEDLATDVLIRSPARCGDRCWDFEEGEPEEGVGGWIARLEEEGVEVPYLLASRLGIRDADAENSHW